MKTIRLFYQGMPHVAFTSAQEGSVWRLLIHGLEYPPELRANPPRVRLREDAHHGHVLAELLDPWPDAPEYWPPATAPEVGPKKHARRTPEAA